MGFSPNIHSSLSKISLYNYDNFRYIFMTISLFGISLLGYIHASLPDIRMAFDGLSFLNISFIRCFIYYFRDKISLFAQFLLPLPRFIYVSFTPAKNLRTATMLPYPFLHYFRYIFIDTWFICRRRLATTPCTNVVISSFFTVEDAIIIEAAWYLHYELRMTLYMSISSSIFLILR